MGKNGEKEQMRGNLEIKVGIQGKLSHTKETINSMYNRKEQTFREKIRKLIMYKIWIKRQVKGSFFRG